MPPRDLPSRPSLEYYKKQAKDLAKARNVASPEAFGRIRDYHPRWRGLPDSEIQRAQFKLSDAQWIIAREYGFDNWSEFTKHLRILDGPQSPRIQVDGVELAAEITVPERATGLVLFAAASSTSRYNPRNRALAEILNRGTLGTILTDLLTEEEELMDAQTEELRFDLRLLSSRIAAITDWISRQPKLKALALGYLASATAAAATFVTAAERPAAVRAIVSIAGRPDLAGPWLGNVQAPALLIVGGNDSLALGFNHSAMKPIPRQTVCKLEIVEGARQLFEDQTALQKSAAFARDWFCQHLTR